MSEQERLERIEAKLDSLILLVSGKPSFSSTRVPAAPPMSAPRAAGGLFGSGGSGAPGGQGGGPEPSHGPVASDDDLDGKYGNPEVRKDPTRWRGESMVGKRYSDCPAEYLDVLASLLDWRAEQDEKKGDPRAKWPKLDAARARGWAMRLRGAGGQGLEADEPPAPSGGKSWEAPAGSGDAYEADSEVPFLAGARPAPAALLPGGGPRGDHARPMAWYVRSSGGSTQGPLDEAAIVSAISQQQLDRSATVNKVGSLSWDPIGSHPPFDRALTRSAPPPSPGPGLSAPTPSVAPPPSIGPELISLARPAGWIDGDTLRLGFYALGSIASLVYLASALASVVAELRAAARGTAGASLLMQQASSTAEAARVSFTNPHASPVFACVRGVISSRATNTRIESQLVCTGDMPPHTTVRLEAPYDNGAVLEFCGKPGPLDTRVIDWNKCSFAVIDQTATLR